MDAALSCTLTGSDMKPCGFQPPTNGYGPCIREYAHEGPCAHEYAGRDERFYKLKVSYSPIWQATFVYYAEPTDFRKFDDRSWVQLVNNHRMWRSIKDGECSPQYHEVIEKLKALGRFVEVLMGDENFLKPRHVLHRDLCLPDTPEVQALLRQL